MGRTANEPRPEPTAVMDIVFPGSPAVYRFAFYGADGQRHVAIFKDVNAPPAYSIFEGTCSCPGCVNHGYCKHLDVVRIIWGQWASALDYATRHQADHGYPVKIAMAPGWQEGILRPPRPPRPDPEPTPVSPSTEELLVAWEDARSKHLEPRYAELGDALAARLREGL